MRVLLIIPAFNEEKNIVSVVRQIREQGYDYVVINDGSKDRTQEICREHNINVINLSSNLGIGGAVQTGHKYAFSNNYDVDIQIDGDGQHDISFIPAMLTEIANGADLVIGSRFLENSQGFKSSFMRRVGIKWLSGLIRMLYKKKITDPTSGLRASGRRSMEYFSSNYPTDYPEPESIVALLKRKMEIREVPVQMKARFEGKSSITITGSVYYMIKVTLAMLIEAFSRPAKKRKK
ncbi:MAG: glycosyltransferase family 2 protein [Coriobacteriia bacterium]|nr:glycosyltransferase family 2 protein [Coriobacteriia bacterium]MCL2750850.1 glycosyltransferase family 2 protein [Coriobacteriia bacterium]